MGIIEAIREFEAYAEKTAQEYDPANLTHKSLRYIIWSAYLKGYKVGRWPERAIN